VQVFCLVALTNRAPSNEVADEATVVWHEERGVEPVQCLLNTFMAHAMWLE
jgi:hypothetical protein